MAGIYMAMNTAKLGLMAHQIALEVTGQNLANVNNPNYTRQELSIEAAQPVSYGGSPGMIGAGVLPTTIFRHQDTFLESQRNLNVSQQNYWDTRQNFLSRLEVSFNETSGQGLNYLFDKFFQSWQDLSYNPKGLTERTAVTAAGRNIGSMFYKVNQDVKNLKGNLNDQVTNSVTEINRITTEIVRMNQAIHEAEGNNVHANDFRDKRESLIRDLSGFMKINAVEDAQTRQTTVYLSTGRPLVLGQSAFTLGTQIRSDDPLATDITWRDTNGNATVITDEIQEGSVGASIQLRDTEMQGYLDSLDQLAATMMRDINKLHGEGYGLDGSTGVDFFTGIQPSATFNSNNTGTGFPTVSVTAPDQLNLHKFTISAAGANSFTVTDATFGNTVVPAGATLVQVQSYFAGQGMSFNLAGAANAGDSYTVNAAADASYRMQVNSAVVNDSRKVAAGLTSDAGNGSNAQRLAAIQNSDTMNQATAVASGTATFAEFYNSIVGQVAVSAHEATVTYNQQEGITVNLNARHQQIAGVSVDEEMINMIKYQHAYQASARMISVTDELLQTLLGLGG
ncbi:MAG: flagellar hook-associated protein FlgK [Nitrospinae bacterium]|nr:flagellar hook-associated protein FlgK [Nitrospinota bacterium]